MAEQFDELSEELTEFIHQQKIFFVGSAAADGRVNISPKGMGSLKVLGPNEILWMNLTGSGNETAAHLKQINRITLMWCSFEGLPRILRCYGSAQVLHPRDEAFEACAALLPGTDGTRQYFKVSVDLVQTSCGYAVPFFDYVEDRQVLTKWAEKRGRDGVEAYWAEKNQESLDGFPTGVLND